MFQVELPERSLNAATPRELLQTLGEFEAAAIAVRSPRIESAPAERAALTGELPTTPSGAKSLPEVLDWHADQQPQRVAIELYGEGERPEPISYSALRNGARAIAAGLRDRGVEQGQTVAIMLPTERAYFTSFFGILLAGAAPVPIYPPARPNQIEEHLERHARILDNARTALLITVSEAKLLARLLRARVPTLGAIVTPAELERPASGWINTPVAADDLAFVQYTSGSTGDPKGVMLSHANLLANIRAMAQRLEVGANDVFVSWLPLYHDMGLIGACLGSIYQGMPLVAMSPLRFLRRPESWLWAIHRHRGTISAGPNFAYELCLRNIDDASLDGLDLGSWRVAANGAEPVSAATMRRFIERFEPYGLRPQAIAPVYGLAECSVGLALPKSNRGLRVDRVAQQALAVHQEARPVTPGEAVFEAVGCGHALPGHQLRVVDSDGRELPERREGLLQFKGPSATRGYLRNAAATAALFDGDWLQTGDRGYIVNGDAFLTGRVKDLIIRGGRNIYPYELEDAVGAIEGVRKGCVAVFAANDPVDAGDRLVVVAETRVTAQAQRDELIEQIRRSSMEVIGLAADDIVLAPPHAVLKTSSGKIRRAATSERYRQGTLTAGARSIGWQLARLTGASLLPQCRRWLRRVGAYGYCSYGWLIGALLASAVAVAILVLPGWRWRWSVSRGLGRLAWWALGCKLQVTGLSVLASDQPVVLVANHSSYLDSLLLVLALPRPVRFVAKRELAGNPLLKHLLDRMGTLFVERFDRQAAQVDSERTIAVAVAGDHLAFFPEGTFTRSPGLLPFRMGAFVTAAQAGSAVVPVVMSGTRSVLRAGSWFLHRGDVQVTLSPPIVPIGSDWQSAVALRTAARAVLLKLSGEPDLADETSPLADMGPKPDGAA